MILGLLSYERPAELSLTLKSIHSAWGHPSDIRVYDDGSQTWDMVSYLYGDSPFKLQTPFIIPRNDDVQDRLGDIPNIYDLTPIYLEFPLVKVIPDKNLGIIKRALKIQKSLFEESSDDYIMLVEADTVFRKDAFSTLQGLLDPSFAITSLMNIAYYPSFNPTIGTTAQCWIIHRQFHELCLKKDYYNFPDRVDHRKSDIRRVGLCKQWKLKWRLIQPGLCQHIGINSIAWGTERGERNWLFDKTTVTDNWF